VSHTHSNSFKDYDGQQLLHIAVATTDKSKSPQQNFQQPNLKKKFREILRRRGLTVQVIIDGNTSVIIN
jgi:hypothetical protein